MGGECPLSPRQFGILISRQAMGVLKTLYPGDYHVTVVSSETFTTFTPLLPCKLIVHRSLTSITIPHIAAAVGTVQVRSLIEPIRKLIARLRGHFVQGKAVDVAMQDQLLEVETMGSDGESRRVYIPYRLPSFCRLPYLLRVFQVRQAGNRGWVYLEHAWSPWSGELLPT